MQITKEQLVKMVKEAVEKHLKENAAMCEDDEMMEGIGVSSAAPGSKIGFRGAIQGGSGNLVAQAKQMAMKAAQGDEMAKKNLDTLVRSNPDNPELQTLAAKAAQKAAAKANPFSPIDLKQLPGFRKEVKNMVKECLVEALQEMKQKKVAKKVKK